MPIYLADINAEVVIRKITGSDKIKKHLQTLGFIEGEKAQVINKVDENVIIRVKGVTLAISFELARRILI